MLSIRRAAAPLASFTLVIALGACGEDDESVFNAEVGECVESISDLSGDIESLPETECTEDHEAEIFFLFEHEGDDDDFPGEDALREEAAEACQGDEFEDYVDVPYDETAIGVAYITPSPESWGQGDRETICVLGLADQTVDESFEGNGDDFPLSAGGSGDSGDTEDFSALIESCEGGDNAACDELYFITPPDSEEERIGATCGGRSDEELDGACEATLG